MTQPIQKSQVRSLTDRHSFRRRHFPTSGTGTLPVGEAVEVKVLRRRTDPVLMMVGSKTSGARSTGAPSVIHVVEGQIGAHRVCPQERVSLQRGLAHRQRLVAVLMLQRARAVILIVIGQRNQVDAALIGRADVCRRDVLVLEAVRRLVQPLQRVVLVLVLGLLLLALAVEEDADADDAAEDEADDADDDQVVHAEALPTRHVYGRHALDRNLLDRCRLDADLHVRVAVCCRLEANL